MKEEYDFIVAVVDEKYNIVAFVDEIGDKKAWELVEANKNYNFACFDKSYFNK